MPKGKGFVVGTMAVPASLNIESGFLIKLMLSFKSSKHSGISDAERQKYDALLYEAFAFYAGQFCSDESYKTQKERRADFKEMVSSAKALKRFIDKRKNGVSEDSAVLIKLFTAYGKAVYALDTTTKAMIGKYVSQYHFVDSARFLNNGISVIDMRKDAEALSNKLDMISKLNFEVIMPDESIRSVNNLHHPALEQLVHRISKTWREVTGYSMRRTPEYEIISDDYSDFDDERLSQEECEKVPEKTERTQHRFADFIKLAIIEIQDRNPTIADKLVMPTSSQIDLIASRYTSP